MKKKLLLIALCIASNAFSMREKPKEQRHYAWIPIDETEIHAQRVRLKINHMSFKPAQQSKPKTTPPIQQSVNAKTHDAVKTFCQSHVPPLLALLKKQFDKIPLKDINEELLRKFMEAQKALTLLSQHKNKKT